MQKTSTEYVESMKKPLRNRAYIKASIGIVNSEAQEAINYNDNDLTYFSSIENVINGISVKNVYATSEENFTSVNKTMYFLPDEYEGYEIYNNGLVTESILGTLTVNFTDMENIDIKGLTIDFGVCYPTKFNIITDNDTRYYENEDSLFITGDSFNNISFIRIKPIEMVGGQDRLRIVSFLCGVTKLFTNENTFNASITDYSSPIAESIPSMDMSITVDNQDQYYCPDDDNSAYAALEQGQTMKMQYGYDVNGDGNIEWLQPYKCYLTQWSATDKDATFSGVDIFEYKLKDMYINGKYSTEGVTLYSIAEDVFEEAGFHEGEYRIDSYLKNIIIHNPMPIVTQAEALQIIANAGRCVLKIERDGVIALECSFIPETTISANNQTEYSSLDNILNISKKDFYTESSLNYPTVDKTMILFPDDDSYVENTGYISESIYAGENGVYAWTEEAPKITITFDVGWEFYGLSINFVSLAPKELNITTYLENQIVQTWNYSNPDINFVAYTYFDECDKIEITITKGNPNARVFISSILVSSITDYRLTRNFDLTDSPNAERMDKVQSISVITNDYLKSNDTQSAEITLTVDSGTSEHIITFDKPGYEFSVTLVEGTAALSVVDNGAYFIKVEVTVASSTTIKIKIEAKCYDIATKPYIKTYDISGQIIEWNNPLISDMEYAPKMEKWLAQYLLGNVDYTVTWRGDPRVDANDLFYMELKDLPTRKREDTIIRAYQSKLDFNGGWKGELKARKADILWQ